MAWLTNKQSEVNWEDNAGDIGGFLRQTTDSDATAIGPIYSPDGTAHWIVVDDLGVLSTVTTKP